MALTYWYMAGEVIHGFPPAFRQIGSGYLLGLPTPVYLLVLFLAIGTVFAQRTDLGSANLRYRRQSGGGAAIGHSDRCGGSCWSTRFRGTMAGLASLIFPRAAEFAEGDIGESLTLPAIAAVLIGGTSLFGGVGTCRRHLYRRAHPDAGAERDEPVVGQCELAAAGHRRDRDPRGLARHESVRQRMMTSNQKTREGRRNEEKPY